MMAVSSPEIQRSDVLLSTVQNIRHGLLNQLRVPVCGQATRV